MSSDALHTGRSVLIFSIAVQQNHSRRVAATGEQVMGSYEECIHGGV